MAGGRQEERRLVKENTGTWEDGDDEEEVTLRMRDCASKGKKS